MGVPALGRAPSFPKQLLSVLLRECRMVSPGSFQSYQLGIYCCDYLDLCNLYIVRPSCLQLCAWDGSSDQAGAEQSPVDKSRQ